MEAKCSCQHCSQRIAFEMSQAGVTIPCPACGLETKLYVAPLMAPKKNPRLSFHPAVIAVVLISFAIVVGALISTKFDMANPTVNSEVSPSKSSAATHSEVTAKAVLSKTIAPPEPPTLDAITLRYPPITEQDVTRAKALLSILNVTRDDVKDIDFYEFHRDALASGVHAYVAMKKGGRPAIRLVFKYLGDDWIFFNKILIRCDGDLFTIIPKREPDRITGTGYVMELCDELADQNIGVLEKMISAKRCIVRLDGDQSQKDMELSQTTQIRLAQILLLYRYMGGNFDK